MSDDVEMMEYCPKCGEDMSPKASFAEVANWRCSQPPCPYSEPAQPNGWAIIVVLDGKECILDTPVYASEVEARAAAEQFPVLSGRMWGVCETVKRIGIMQ